jgi:hypothetical protein
MSDHNSNLSLHPNHLVDLRKSGLSNETIREAGIYSVRPGDIAKKLGFNDPKIESVMAIPYPGCNGFERYKIFPPQNAKKYVQPKGSQSHLYIPNRLRPSLPNLPNPIVCVEGEKKSLKASQEGLSCLGLGGLWNWSDGSEEKKLITDFDLITWEKGIVYIVPDNDWLNLNRHGYRTNLEQAVRELAYRLIGSGAKVYIVELSKGPLKGLDDFLCEHPADDFFGLPREEVRKDGAGSPLKNSRPWSAKEQPTWPSPLAEEAFYGLAGEFTRLVEPHTEADPVALLVQFLSVAGNIIGATAYFLVEADKHYLKIFLVLVGETSKGRKGVSLNYVKNLFSKVDLQWEKRVVSGLASGEGLIWKVRDGDGDDPGEADKRLLVVESEFASVLRIIGRDGNILSPTIRQAWDDGNLRILTKNSPAVSTGAHISIIGHVTKDELKRYLDRTEMGNGFANRFVWLCVKRSKVLPEGGRIQESDFDPIIMRLREVVEFAQTIGQMEKDEETAKMWAEVYPELSEGKPGLFGAVISRAEAQVMRISCIYAMLDKSRMIRKEHLLAALAVWDYCEESAHFIFGDAVGDPVADEILKALINSSEGLTRTEIRDLFSRNIRREKIDSVLSFLQRFKLIRMVKETTEGKPIERWVLV